MGDPGGERHVEKNEGPGLMVSAFQDERNGFGLPLPGDVLAEVNAKRALDDKPVLKRSPGVRYLESTAKTRMDTGGTTSSRNRSRTYWTPPNASKPTCS